MQPEGYFVLVDLTPILVLNIPKSIYSIEVISDELGTTLSESSFHVGWMRRTLVHNSPSLPLESVSCLHVIEALWMEGVWSWADHIQALHSQSPILRSTKLLGQHGKNLRQMKVRRMKNQCLQDEGVDDSSHHMKAFVWDFEGSRRVPYVPNAIPWRVPSIPNG